MAVVPFLKTWQVGELVNDDMLNTHLTNVTSFALNRPFVFVYRTSSQSIGNGSWTKLEWNNVPLKDTDNMDPSSGTDDYFEIHTKGYYDLKVSATFAGNRNGGRAIRATVNNLTVCRTGQSNVNQADTHVDVPLVGEVQGVTTALHETSVWTGRFLPLNPGDIVRFEVFQDSGSSLNVLGDANNYWTWASIRWLRAS